MSIHTIVLSLRWAARLAGVGVALLMAAIAVGEGAPNPWAMPWRVNLELHLMLTMVVGLLLAWRWATLAGALVVGAVTAFSVIEGRLPGGLFPVILLIGVVHLACGVAGGRLPRISRPTGMAQDSSATQP